MGEMMDSAYILPDGNVQIAFSGGRTSAYMLHQILEANGGLPDRACVIFTNTGREMPETLDFVQECGGRWGVKIVWLEYKNTGKPSFVEVSHNSASRNGEPFREMCLSKSKQGLPNTLVRFCTAELKVRTAKRYLVSIGWENWNTALGMRFDEPTRIKATPKERFDCWYPLYEAQIGKHQIGEFWNKQQFDLRLPSASNKTPLGNCDGCFLKSQHNLAHLAREHPERFRWWVDLETEINDRYAKKRGRMQTFRKHETYASLGEFVSRQGDWIFDDENGVLCQANGGDCTG